MFSAKMAKNDWVDRIVAKITFLMKLLLNMLFKKGSFAKNRGAYYIYIYIYIKVKPRRNRSIYLFF